MAYNVNATNMADAIKVMYEKRLLSRALPRLVHGRWGRPATLNKFGSMEIRKYSALSAISSTLAEGTTPTEQSAPSISTVTLDPNWYGAWIGITDQVQLESMDPLVLETSAILGEQAGLSADTLVRNALISGATAAYTGGVSATTSLDAPDCNIGYADVVKAIGTLEAANARPVDGGRFVLILHPHSYASLMQDATFVNLFVNETEPNALRTGKMGYLLNCDIYISSNAYEAADGGVSNDDIYGAIYIGADSFAVAGMAGLDVKNVDMAGTDEYTMTGKSVRPVDIIVKPVDSGGAENPLNQRGSIGWKMTHDCEILDSTWILNQYHTNVFSAD